MLFRVVERDPVSDKARWVIYRDRRQLGRSFLCLQLLLDQGEPRVVHESQLVEIARLLLLIERSFFQFKLTEPERIV